MDDMALITNWLSSTTYQVASHALYGSQRGLAKLNAETVEVIV
jgi:hypothetical protein